MRFKQLVCGALRVNAYIAGADDTPEVAVIDPGAAKPVIDYLEANGLRCTHILITHGHFDHIGGAAELRERTGAHLYIHEDDAGMLGSNRASLAFLAAHTLRKTEADRVLRDGDEFDAAGLHYRVIHTPGHSPGGVCYVLEEQRIIFCGDTLFFEGVGRTDFPGCSQRTLYRAIVDKLYSLEGDYDVYCGHDRQTTLAHERANNPFTVYAKQFQW